MAVMIALEPTLGQNAVSTIFTFLDESSVAATCESDAADLADVAHVSNRVWPTMRFNQGLQKMLYQESLEYTTVLMT